MNQQENYLRERISKIASDIENFLLTLPSRSATSWEIKINLKLPSSLMYMAIGKLISEKKINVISENLIYKISLLTDTLSDVQTPQ